jgi:transcriptional regulator with XRE-family HTH domain
VARPHERQDALGAALREARLDHGFTQEQLQEIAKVNQARISELETGQTNPTWVTLRKICTALGIKISDLALRVEELEETER